MKPNLKKEHARLLFTQEKLSQKEIAERVCVSEQTITKWVNADKGEWKRLRQSLVVTKSEQLSRIYEQLDELNLAIRQQPEGKRYASTKEADTLVKLTAAAKNLESDASIADTVEVSKRFLNWLRPLAPNKAKEIAAMFDDFIRELLKR
jgi:transposase